MTSRPDQLWELISNHPMPVTRSGTPFTDRLMQEHRIKRDTAETAIAEYRKFINLCATRDARNVPSKAVDLVWHLHMQYSRDYWNAFCGKIGKPIHHDPGGDDRAHLDDYKATVAAYRDRFGIPPKGVWRERGGLSNRLGMMFAGVFVVFGLTALLGGGAPVLFMMLWLAIPTFVIAQCLYGLTTKGELQLTFEMRDPFADKDAGDCGSGDGGGCGD